MEQNIHFICLGETPEWAESNIDRFRRLNPGWRVMIHGDIPEGLPDVYRAALAKAMTVGGQCDILRMAVLEMFGGWYFDWDVYALRPIAETKTNALLGAKLLLWQIPHCGGFLGSSICAAAKDSVAWPVVHEVMASIARGESPDPRYFERFMCDTFRFKRPELYTIGDVSEFTIQNDYWPKDKEFYGRLLAGETMNTNACAFLHGWAETSVRPAVVLGE